MDELLKIVSLNGQELDMYIKNRFDSLNTGSKYADISLSDDGGDIYPNWIDTNTPYLPSGTRSLGFKIDFQFIKDFVEIIKETFASTPLDKIRDNFVEEVFTKWILMQIKIYFATTFEYDEDKRKDIYEYGTIFNLNNETLNISELKGMDVARCIEKSAGLNAILNFLGINSSLVLSDANNVGHAYCLVKIKDNYFIADPNFSARDINNNLVLYVFKINPNDKKISFDPLVFGAEGLKVDYDFPSDKMTKGKGENLMKNLINSIISDEDLSIEDKSTLLERVVRASHGFDKFVAPGYYLHTDKNNETGEIDMQLWYRNEDDSGMTFHGPTNYGSDKIVEMMKEEYLSQKGNTR